MSEVVVRIEEECVTTLTNVCSDLFVKWLVDLTPEEKEIWLWNASIEMYKIKQRRH